MGLRADAPAADVLNVQCERQILTRSAVPEGELDRHRQQGSRTIRLRRERNHSGRVRRWPADWSSRGDHDRLCAQTRQASSGLITRLSHQASDKAVRLWQPACEAPTTLATGGEDAADCDTGPLSRSCCTTWVVTTRSDLFNFSSRLCSTFDGLRLYPDFPSGQGSSARYRPAWPVSLHGRMASRAERGLRCRPEGLQGCYTIAATQAVSSAAARPSYRKLKLTVRAQRGPMYKGKIWRRSIRISNERKP